MTVRRSRRRWGTGAETGSWAMCDARGWELKVAIAPKPVEHWAIVSFAPSSQVRADDLDCFAELLTKVGRERGIALAPPASVAHKGDPSRRVEEFLERLSSDYAASRGAELVLLVLVLPDTGTSSYLYPSIKRWSHTKRGDLRVQALKMATRDSWSGSGR